MSPDPDTNLHTKWKLKNFQLYFIHPVVTCHDIKCNAMLFFQHYYDILLLTTYILFHFFSCFHIWPVLTGRMTHSSRQFHTCFCLTKNRPQKVTFFIAFSHFSYIFMVPLGPRFDLRTSCRPLAALVLMAKAWAALATSALGFNAFTADMFSDAPRHLHSSR